MNNVNEIDMELIFDTIKKWQMLESNHLDCSIKVVDVTSDKMVKYKKYYNGQWHEGQVPYDYIVEVVKEYEDK